jgi:hypothetical protein
MTREQRRRKAWKKWRQMISVQAASGQAITAFCRERGLSRQSFFAWKKRLQQAGPKDCENFVELKVTKAMVNAAESVRGQAAVEVRLQNGRSLLVGPGFDADHMRSLLAVLESA